MKQIFYALLVFGFSVLVGSFVIWYAVHERPEKEITFIGQDIHTVRCMDDQGNLETYHINIPSEVKDIDKFAEGFCESLKVRR